MQTLSMRMIFVLLAAALLNPLPASALGNVVEPEADEVPGTSGGIPPPPGEPVPVTPSPSNAPGSNTVYPTAPEVAAECRPASENCPVTDAGRGEVIMTDELPLGSTVKRADDDDPNVSESGYPTSVGSGSAGSGITGTPTGPAGVAGTPANPQQPGPVIGIGR